MSDSFWWLVAALSGLVFGSFLNVVVHRLPLRLSVVWPGSFCPHCKQPIRWYDNVPVLSWLLLRGRCRWCGEPISFRYPLVELVTAALFVASVARFGARPAAIVACVFVALLVALALIDLEHFLLPDLLTYPGMVLGLLGSFFATWTSPLSALMGAVGGALFLLLLIAVWYVVRRQLGMGLGDPKMLAMIGAFLGLPKTVATLFLASVIGSLVSVLLLATGRAARGTRLPFGVFLAIGGGLALFFGDALIGWYLRVGDLTPPGSGPGGAGP